MGLNIVATRKFSLKDFAEGWGDCFITLRAANEAQRKGYADRLMDYQSEMDEVKATGDESKIKAFGAELDQKADAAVREFAAELIVGGKVITTNDDGTTELVNFGKDDVSTIIEVLGFAWLNELVEVATGNDRLKVRI